MSSKSGIKVLHIIKTLNLGGAESNLYHLLESGGGLAQSHIAYSYGGAFEANFLKLQKTSFFKYASKPYKIKSFASLGIIYKLARYIRENDIKIVHTHNYNGHIWGLMAAKLVGAKVVEHVHDFRYEEADYLRERNVRPGQFNQAVFFGKMSDRIIVLTENNKNYLLKRGVSANKIKILRNGIQLTEQQRINRSDIKASLSLSPNKKIVLFAARISPEKNTKTVIQIAENIQSEDVLFIIAGDGPEKAELEAHLSVEAKNRVKFIGFYPHVTELLAITDVFIQPTLLELHSITMLEAMKMSVPALVSKHVGCNDDFVTDGVNGILLDPLDAEVWAQEISELLVNPEKAKKIGNEGRGLVEKECDIRQTAQRLEKIYEELAS